MDSQRNTSYTSKMISFPLRSIEKNYAFEELNETGIKIEFVEEGKRNGGLNVFSKIESYGEIEDTDLQKTVAAFLFKNVEKSYRNFSNFISKTKEEFNLTETTLEKIKDTFYQYYGLLFYLKVNICMVNEFHYPETALMPLVMEKKISKDIYDKWPITE
uniref:Peptidase_M16_M domain-containing protein n=1 Tax=Strongyloides papillosus TaxID=174720 RepID=A0A0N5BHA8_STREA